MSTKKMHPPAVIHPSTGQTGGKGSLLPVSCGKTTAKDRQNVENIVPAEPPAVAQNPVTAAATVGGKKATNAATATAKTAAAVNPAPAQSRRNKNHRNSNMSPSRKRQEQQSIFNNLRSWNVKIVTPQEKRAQTTPSSSNEATAAKVAPVPAPTDKSSSSSSTSVVNGTAASSSSSNTSSSSSISNVTSGNSISGSVKAKKQQSQLMAAVMPVATTTSVPVPKESVANGKNEQQKKVEVATTTENQPAAAATKKDTAATCSVGTKACDGGSKVDGKTTGASATSKDEKKLLNGGTNGFGGRHSAAIPASSLTAPPPPQSSSLSASVVGSGSSVLHPSSSSSAIPVVSSTGSGSCSSSKHNSSSSRASNAGKVLLPNVNPLDQFAVLQGKLRNSMSAPPPSAPQQSHHNIPHHPHSTAAHNHQQQSQQQQQQQSQSIPSTTTTSPQYSLEFLRYMGMQMSGTGGTTSQSTAAAAAQAAALFRGNPHFNYSTFNQQLHPQQQPSQQHLQRHYSGYYEEMMLPAGGTAVGGGGDATPLYNGYPVADHLAAAASNANTGDSLAYCYSQNHQHSHNHPQHQHQHNHPPHQQQQQQQPPSTYGNGSYHQNNNYQQHNRNYGSGRSGQSNGGGGNMQGRKTWNNNNNSWHGKRPNMMQGGKYGNINGIKGPNMSHGGYRKSYHYYNNNNNHHNHHHTNGHHHDPHHQQQHQDHMRNLVYIRGYDRGQGAASSSQESTSRSPTPSPQSESPAIDTASETAKVGTVGSSGSSVQDEKSDSGIEDGAAILKKSGAVPSSSSSSSSVVSIPSTDSSVISSTASQNLSLDLNGATGQGYESDSSHSSSYNSHTYRHRKYANGGQVYRSSSSTSSGVSSTATFPPLVVDFATQTSASTVNTPTASATSQQVADFFLRSQSYHGSHQNLTTVSGSASPNPPDSPVGAARPLVGTQSMPMFSELFTGQQHHNHHQQQPQQRTHPNSSYGSNSSLDSTLQNVIGGTPASASASSNNSSCSIVSNTSSSGYGSAPASTVPPNEAYSMQSGHPRRRFSGRSSPAPYAEQQQQQQPHKPNRSSFGGSNTAVNSSSQQQQPPSPPSHNRKGQQSAWSTHRPVTVPTSTTTTAVPPPPQVPPPPTSVPPPAPSNNLSLLHSIDGTNYHTPADRFLARSHLVELLTPPVDLAPTGSKYAALSSAVWDKFAAAQQTQHKFVQKIQLWRYLFMCIRKAFPRFSLYLVGSTISGFASDNSDVDMCLVCRANNVPFDMRGEALFQLGQLKNYFMNINTYFEEFSVIQAKVPILRFRDSTNCIVVDLNYNNCVGIRNSHLLYCYSQLDWRLRPLTLVVKLWAQHHNINDAKNMTISSYSLVLMVIHFLQYGVSPPILPCLHAMYPDKFVDCPTLQRMSDISNLDLTETMEPYKNDNSQSLGELFMQFLEYYANFDYTQYAISVRTASVIPIESARVARSYKNDPHHWRQLCIEEPFDLTNTARSVFDAEIFEQIKSVFSTSWRRLKDTNDLSSIFECDPLFIPVASTLSITS